MSDSTAPQRLGFGIIPARGGSKGVPRKNIRLVAGQPLIAYTIAAARASQALAAFAVTTDDEEIAAVVEGLGCPVIRRPAELAGDTTPMDPVVAHALSTWSQRSNRNFEYGVLLQPTTPLRTASDIDKALEILVQTGADTVISVCQVSDHHPSRMYRLEQDRLIPYAAEPPGRIRQQLPAVYHRNGAIYAFRTRSLQEQGVLVGEHKRPYLMPAERSVNIDEELDLLFAEFLLSRRAPAT